MEWHLRRPALAVIIVPFLGGERAVSRSESNQSAELKNGFPQVGRSALRRLVHPQQFQGIKYFSMMGTLIALSLSVIFMAGACECSEL